jgi:hypothetical protein
MARVVGLRSQSTLFLILRDAGHLIPEPVPSVSAFPAVPIVDRIKDDTEASTFWELSKYRNVL